MDKTYCLKHYRQTWADVPCDMCALEDRAQQAEQTVANMREHNHVLQTTIDDLENIIKAYERLRAYRWSNDAAEAHWKYIDKLLEDRERVE